MSMDIATSKNGKRGLIALFALLLVFLYIPLVVLVGSSFTTSNTPQFPPRDFSVSAYQQFASNPELKASLLTSAKVATFASVLTVALGILAAIVLVRRHFLGRSGISALFLSPLVIPYIALAIGLLIFLNEAPIVEPGMSAIVIGHVVLSIPYAILILVPRLERVDATLEDAARDLGAGSFQTFRLITFPLILPAIVSAFIVSFVLSFDEIVVASFVNGTTTTFPLYLFSQVRFPELLPQVIAVAVIIMAASALLLIGAELGRRMVERRIAADLAEPAPSAGA
jgi:spermidine/putrescine transport system permease protein